MTDVLVHYPTRSRPQLFRKRVQEYLADPIARLLVTIDADDPTMANDEMYEWMHALADKRLTWRVGNCKSKVEACNDGVAEELWDIIILASDDMVPQRADYASRIVSLHKEHFPDGDGVLHLNDGRVGRCLNTLCVCDRAYYSRFNYLYHPSFSALWCDNEWQDVSEQLGRAVYVNEVIIKHDWIGQTHPRDELLRSNESHNESDARTYRLRKAAGFPQSWPI